MGCRCDHVRCPSWVYLSPYSENVTHGRDQLLVTHACASGSDGADPFLFAVSFHMNLDPLSAHSLVVCMSSYRSARFLNTVACGRIGS